VRGRFYDFIDLETNPQHRRLTDGNHLNDQDVGMYDHQNKSMALKQKNMKSNA
jgi:hypothetical protein